MKYFASTLVAVFLLSPALRAQVNEVKLPWKETKKQAVASKASSLQKQKKREFEKKWAECAALGKTNFKKYSAVKAWVLISWLRCSRELSAEKNTSGALKSALRSLDAAPQFLISGPWVKPLWSESIRARLFLMDQLLKAKSAEAWKQVEVLLEQKEHLDRSQSAKVLSAAGELSQLKAELEAAQFFYEQSLDEQETKATREKLNALLFALNKKKESGKEKSSESPIEIEGQFEERFSSSQKTNDLMALMEDCIAYLQQFPGGRRARWAQDKIIEIYFGFLSQNKDQKMESLRERSLDLMAKSDPLRQLEWAKQLHRRGEYQGCLRIAEKSLESLSSTMNGSVLHYLAGRCGQFSGDYRKARKHFEDYIQKFAGGDDISEVHFRLGLVHLRLGQASSAIAAFERVLLNREGGRYELNSKYWLARSLQATNNTRALAVVDEILAEFPMSYYGLRLRMERNSGFLDWPTGLKTGTQLKGSYYLSQTQMKSFSRAQLLAENGWIAEALLEVSDIPVPTDPEVKALLAKKFNQLQLFPPVIRLVNEAGDLNSDLRSLDIVSLALPQVYKEVIAEQALKQKLSPYLVRSLIRQESAFGPRAISTSNAYGLMQIIGPTAQEIVSELGLKGLLIPEDVFVPENNIQMGTYYISKMIKQFGGNVPLGLAAYNAGPTRMRTFVNARKEVSEQVEKFSSDPWDEMWFDELPWYETSFYVKAILRNTILYQVAEKAEAKNPDQRRVRFDSVLWSHLVLKP